jgi:hypothetical protein
MAKRAVAGAKAGFKALSTATFGAIMLRFSKIVTIHQKLMIQVSAIDAFASKI